MYSFQLMAFIRRRMKGKIITYMILWISLAHRIMCFGRGLLSSKLCFSFTKNVSLFWPFGIGNSQFCVAFEMDLCCQKLGRWLFIVVQPDNDQVICLFSTQIQIHKFLGARYKHEYLDSGQRVTITWRWKWQTSISTRS